MALPFAQLGTLMRSAHPGRVVLSAQDISVLILGLKPEDFERVVDAIQTAKSQANIPRVRRIGKTWGLPIEGLAAVSTAPAAEEGKPKRRSRHSTIGPRLLLQRERSKAALQAVLDAIAKEQAERDYRTLSAMTPAAPARRRGGL